MRTTAIDSNRVAFRTRLFGFDKADVHALLSNLLAECEQARAQVEVLKGELSRVRSALAAEPTPQQTETAHLVERILSSAHHVADEIRKETEQESARLIADAEGRAARLVEEAATEAAKKSDAATDRLRAVEREVERMQMCHREVRTALESTMTLVGATLAHISACCPVNVAGPDDEASNCALETFQREDVKTVLSG